MIIMALDASTKSTGVAIYKDKELLEKFCLTENDKDVHIRILKMTDKILKLYKEYNIDEYVMEEVIPDDVGKNQTVYRALIYLQANIVLNIYKINQKLPIFFTASHWRSRCGIPTGRGVTRDTLKTASINFVKNTYGNTVNDDVADAICIGYCYTHKEEKESTKAKNPFLRSAN